MRKTTYVERFNRAIQEDFVGGTSLKILLNQKDLILT